MEEGEPVRVQPVADISRKRRVARLGHSSFRIERIPYDGMTRGREVDADLMRASGLDPDFDE